MKGSKAHIVLFFALITKLASSQVNLIPNGNFEYYKKLPGSLFIVDNLNFYTNDWYTPLLGNTPDYFNYLNTIAQIQYPFIITHPNFLNHKGDSIRKEIIPVSGQGFIGFGNSFINSVTDNLVNKHFTEYFGVDLKINLKKNHKYWGSFYYNNFGSQSLIIEDLGMLLFRDTSDLELLFNGSWIPTYFNCYPQVKNDNGLLSNSNVWVQISDKFKANGNEKKAMIGYFRNPKSKESLDSNYASIEPSLGRYSFQNYFFIDSVTLYEIPCLVAQDTACKGDSISFYHTFTGNAIWTTNADSTQEVIGIDSVYRLVANQSGWYYVFTPTGKDSTYLTVIETPTIDLGIDTFVCVNKSILIKPTYTYANNFEWQNGTSQPTFVASKQGWYWVKAANAGCSRVDSIYLTEQPLPDKLTQHQFTICTATQQYATLVLNDDYTYYWQTLTDTLNAIKFTQAGCEKVTIESEYGCLIDDEVCIEDICGAKVFVPNAFTPNGVNPFFKPVTKYVSAIHWEVFNRWGERVFVTDNMDASWDGTFNGTLCNSDVYFYKVTYTDLINSQRQSIKGNVTLLR